MRKLVLESSSPERATEKWTFPVLTVLPAPTTAKGKFRVELNKTGVALFEVGTETKRVSIVVEEENPSEWFLVDTDTKQFSGQLNKNGSISNKVVYTNLVNSLDLNTAREYNFLLRGMEEESEHYGFKVYKMILATEEQLDDPNWVENATTTTQEIIQEEIELVPGDDLAELQQSIENDSSIDAANFV